MTFYVAGAASTLDVDVDMAKPALDDVDEDTTGYYYSEAIDGSDNSLVMYVFLDTAMPEEITPPAATGD